ncbi:hypothetical protein SAMN03159444_05529 [Pseudomonas sp. NFACC02]|uniref:hypothetical protein n=1 Tax=Pseudomonas sp. NFACC02 TaxID=1566250 RepID=UPI0008D1E627|nr:hypothetical protein [Pseudomonas sp. NFACC02]SER96047.1 hypothetical protein SAMN03159444_05529 [Pseudomonas sp. NFACC02]
MMNVYRLIILSSSLLLLAAGGQQAVGAERSDPVYQGRLEIYGGNEGNALNCSLPFDNGNFPFKNMEDCNNDNASAFKLIDVPSAAFITFFDAPDCASHDNFIIKMKTVKHPTNTETPVDLTAASKKNPNEVIAPGIIMVNTENDQGQIKDKLSCVKIERSTGPDS